MSITKGPAFSGEVCISCFTAVGSAASACYCIRLNEVQNNTTEIAGSGNAIDGAVVADVVERRISGSHQSNKPSCAENVDVYEPLEEGLNTDTETQMLSAIQNTHSTETLDAAGVGSQPPVDESPVTKYDSEDISRERGRGQGRGKGGSKTSSKGKGKERSASTGETSWKSNGKGGKGMDKSPHKGKGKGRDESPIKGNGKGKPEAKGNGKGMCKGKFEESPMGKRKGQGMCDQPKGKGNCGNGRAKAFGYYAYPPVPKGKGKHGGKSKRKDSGS